MKILDRYILTTYLRTFISVFLILMLIFILQTIWLYIRELSGKDLDLLIVGKFLIYFMPKLIPLVLPLTILLASIMVFGNFAENYEFAAMKSTGISLQRAMSGLSIFIVGLAITTFFFSNNVIPWAELNSYNLRKNIAKLKPAAAIAEGQFNKIESTPYTIKVEKKYGENDKFLEDVTIHMKGSDGRKNTTIIRSKTGELASSEDSDVLKLILYDGNYYSEMSPSKTKDKKKKPFAKSKFEKYIINIDLSKMNNVDLDEQTQTDKYNMLPISGLRKAIDSLEQRKKEDYETLAKVMFSKSSVVERPKKNKKNITKIPEDSIYTGEILDVFNTRKKLEMVDAAGRQLTTSKQVLVSKKEMRKRAKSLLNRHYMSFYDKFALGFACIILFFVGAPLGALIRKGGIGLPMVIAILLFLTYHFIGIFATNSSKNGSFNPILASWTSTLIMLPLSVFLTRKATADKNLFEGDGLFEFLKKIFRLKKKDEPIDTSVFDVTDSEYGSLDAYHNDKLINILKNHKEFGYKAIYRNTALAILNKRGITSQQLKFSGNYNNREYEQTINLKNKFEEDLNLTFVLYIISLVASIVGAILDNNNFPGTGTTLLVLGTIATVLFIISFVKLCFSEHNLRKQIGKGFNSSFILVYVIGIPLFFIGYYLLEKDVKNSFNLDLLDDKNGNKIELSDIANKAKQDYKAHSIYSLVLYSLGVILLIGFFIFRNNKLPHLASAAIQLSIVSLVLFAVYYFKSLFNLNRLYSDESLKTKKTPILLLIIGFPLYWIAHIIFKTKIKEDLNA
ncbi:LptF/LptG family permease [Seonamhaeicola marinus]|uniref:YjgP/YjgQ family permease n=1 Tax=Seonamhaeicola marinus TaxID=1912246 RepID=A0A5D0HK45_9FLAO|nr:LptF/LptG family permease [Seonamhaeicola marinus]TYA71764.1 YjgP/YjgQ family permease [Seonamhaeicola marinus]